MPKSKASSKAPPKGQKTLLSFMKRKSKVQDTPTSDDNAQDSEGAIDVDAAASEAETEGAVDTQTVASEPETSEASDGETLAEDEDEDEEDEEEETAPKKKGKAAVAPKASAPDASSLPPINDIPAIFADLVDNAPKLQEVAEHIKGRKLRVATMCSGTESPLLALELIQKALEDQTGTRLEVEHVFSCEIEPFKQAYIERNFQPPLLFRDVCELGDGEAHTAYGALAPVPGDVDMLVAGTSCVDYSNLNTQKQDIDANGESGRTFRGMMSWVTTHRPPLVILENVCSAPWDKVVTYFEKNGYSAQFSRVDTKNYYIPHTRTRVYLIAVNKKSSRIPDEWKDTVLNKLKRPASSTLDEFLLPSDDPRIHLARQKLVQESYGALDRKTGRTDWGRCESRHQRARLEEALGPKRPLTGWDEGGYCKLPDFAWNDWGVGQVERVWDLMDISLLRSASKGVDPSYKTVVWNLSQNVDRTIGSNKVGICPCLTPSMIPYITNRGGPMVGLEALSMQGLPVEKLLLTRESEDQLADLAGNAMSTTVVGACIIAALVCGKKLLKAGDDTETYESKNGHDEEVEAMDVDRAVETKISPTTVVGEENLTKKKVDLSSRQDSDLKDLLAEATESSRLCGCEGRNDMTNRKLFRCEDCGSTFCEKCGGRPEHKATPCEDVRVHPAKFAQEIKSLLPMSLSLVGIDEALLDSLYSQEKEGMEESIWSRWRAAVLLTSQTELRFVEMKRQEIWTVIFKSPSATLEFVLDPKQPEWRLFASPEASEPASAPIRHTLQYPVARLRCGKGLLDGTWEFALPVMTRFSIGVKGVGESVPCWQSRLGLLSEEYKDKMVASKIQVTVSEADAAKLDRDLSGEYVLLDKCGTANGALHKKVSDAKDEGRAPLFMLFDPHRTHDALDCFVFSTDIRRLEYGEYRFLVCKVDPTWRQIDTGDEETVQCELPYKWVSKPSTTLKATSSHDATYGVPGKDFQISLSGDACQNAYALLTCTVPLGEEAGPEWPRGSWQQVDKIHERGTFRSLAWLIEPIRHVADQFNTWQSTGEVKELDCKCERCAPTAPAIRWVNRKGKPVAIEDPVQAGEYERRLKRRPSPFVTELKLDDNGVATVRIGTNILSLLHRAYSRLPTAKRTGAVSLSWRLDTNFTPAANANLPKFALKSNKQDKQHKQPPNFKTPLRTEQLRSLEWMIKQEALDAAPFIEEEISEAVLDPLGWRAEGRATRPVRIRGGVLADQVGYGKTAITLGLIDCTSKTVEAEFEKVERIPGKIAVKATFIIVPPHLTRQWNSEVGKFLKKKMKVVVISTVANLNKVTIEEIQEADIVIVASNIFKSNVYLENLSLLAGVSGLPTRDGRHFNDHLEKALGSLKSQVDRLQDEGSLAVMKEVKDAQKRVQEEEAAAAAAIASKRLKGKSYREAADKAEKKAGPKKPKPAVKPEPSSSKASSPAKPSVSPKAKSNIVTPSGLIPEVVIGVPKGHHSLKSQPEASSSRDASDSEGGVAARKPQRRAAAKRVIVLASDEDESDVEPAPKPTKGKAAKGKPTKKAPAKAKGKKKKAATEESDDYEHSSGEESYEESEMEVDESEEEYDESEPESDVPKKKSNAKPKVKKPAKKAAAPSAATSEAETDDMDVDEPKPAAKKATKKRKAEDGAEPPAKKAKRADNDPWKLESVAVKRDWNQMKAPPFEMFHWARVVVDEYTYLDGKIHALITNLTSERHWVLSGTPPIHDFAAVKTIAAFLDIHLGVDDDGEGRSAEVKKRRREQTAVERFHSFREVHTLEWHAHRHTVGQAFLDQFVRQNIAEIDEIPWSQHKEDIALPAAERAIYLELEHHLRALDMTIKRGKKTESDREKRLNQSLGDSKSAEEALLKRCSHFELDMGSKNANENAMKACDVIVQGRRKQLDECRAELLKAVKAGLVREKALGNLGEESMFNEWVRICRTEGVDDEEANQLINELLDEAGLGTPKSKPKQTEMSLTEKQKAAKWEHREKTHEIRRLTKELVGRIRSLRYFTVVRDIQKKKDQRTPINCPACGTNGVPLSNTAVLSSCGHEGCLACVRRCAENELCVYAESGKCKSAARVINIVKAETLGVDDEVRDGQGKHFGRKLESVVDLIKNRVEKERVLLFVQFPDLMAKVGEALAYHKIKFLEIKGTANVKSKNLENFQNNSKERVLLLNVMDESASGANLTSANHAIFLSPLLAPSNEIYTACETQAIGRLVRFGQTNHVKIWRFSTLNTIDEEIYAQREAASRTS
ncbi:DNA repair protein rad8 [Ephemerocybe angulata]|uniref:DNA repair protein rad8 n=1 Tax=Ephemerocybe angulata TaxID=980116 RepID=A0A8H6IAR6_9AGAR|nr:DNA repair protein rad8 [Tulosesus angulatus]